MSHSLHATPPRAFRSIFHVARAAGRFILKTWHDGIVPPGSRAACFWDRVFFFFFLLHAPYRGEIRDRARAHRRATRDTRWPPSGPERATRQTAAAASPANPPPPPACLPATDAAYASGLGRRRGSAAPTSTRLTGRSSTSVCCSLRHTSRLHSHRQPSRPPARCRFREGLLDHRQQLQRVCMPRVRQVLPRPRHAHASLHARAPGATRHAAYWPRPPPERPLSTLRLRARAGGASRLQEPARRPRLLPAGWLRGEGPVAAGAAA